MNAAQIVAVESHLVRLDRLSLRLREGERFQREAIEGALTPTHADDALEHARLLAYRSGLADGLARAARYIEEQRVELARICRADPEVMP